MILCCGEALVDMIPTSEGAGYSAHVGGAVFNTAITLGRLGAEVGFLYGLSTDDFGTQIRMALTESNVGFDQSIICSRPTTKAIVQLKDGVATYRFEDDNSAGRMLTPQEMPRLDSDVHALFFGGISLAAEPSGEAFAALVEKESANRVTFLDPNIRPAFIAEETRYRRRLAAVLEKTDIVKVSDDDLDWLYPETGSAEAKMDLLAACGPKLVLLTKGSKGAVARLGDGSRVAADAHPANVADTIGAGDSFNGGFLFALEKSGLLSKESIAKLTGQQVLDAMDFAARVAAVTVSREGANPPWANEL